MRLLISLLSIRLRATSIYSGLIFVPFSSAISPVALRRFMAFLISPCSWAAIAENFMERDIGFFSYMENLDLKSSMGRAMFTIISAFAQLERDIIRERTLAGL